MGRRRTRRPSGERDARLDALFGEDAAEGDLLDRALDDCFAPMAWPPNCCEARIVARAITRRQRRAVCTFRKCESLLVVRQFTRVRPRSRVFDAPAVLLAQQVEDALRFLRRELAIDAGERLLEQALSLSLESSDGSCAGCSAPGVPPAVPGRRYSGASGWGHLAPAGCRCGSNAGGVVVAVGVVAASDLEVVFRVLIRGVGE